MLGNKNQWSLESVTNSLHYEEVKYSDCHNIFIHWISKQGRKFDILDIGGGNGRVMINLKSYCNTYTCVDLSMASMRSGIEFFKDDKTIRFIEMDVDDQFDINEKYDLSYIDSVLTMVHKPFELVENLSNVSDMIFINRTLFSDRTEMGKYRWDGMEEESPLWRFSKSDIEDLCEKIGFELEIISGNSFLLKKNSIQ